MKSFVLLLAVVFILTSCEETVQLNLNQTPSKVVIDARLTNVLGKQYVKITRSSNFYQTGSTPRVTDAVVKITDDLGNVMTFVHNPEGKEEKAGYYFPAPGFAGTIGRTYKLSVIVDGVMYSAEDKMLPVTTIDSIKYKINGDQQDDPKVAGRIYELLLFAKEPQQTKDFYLFEYYRNDSLALNRPNDIYFTDDDAVGEKIDGVSSPVYYSINDKAKLEMYSLSRTAFVFYSDFFNLVNSDGGMFSPPPANPRTNLNNGALGLFQVSAVSTMEIVLKPLN